MRGESEDGAGVGPLSTSEWTALVGGDAFSATVAHERAGLRIWRQRKAVKAAAAKAAKAEAKAANGEDQPEVVRDPTFVQPKMPPQGTNHSPWTSYHDLPLPKPCIRLS